jgi:hypothetical protein
MTHTGEHVYRLTNRQRVARVAFGAFIFGVVPALLGALLVGALYATGPAPAVPAPAPVTVVPAPLQPPPAPTPVVVVNA